jgi:hypothetical protein
LRSHPKTIGGTKREDNSEKGVPTKNIKNITNQEYPAAEAPVSPDTIMKIAVTI